MKGTQFNDAMTRGKSNKSKLGSYTDIWKGIEKLNIK